jgi:hypothetical protein
MEISSTARQVWLVAAPFNLRQPSRTSEDNRGCCLRPHGTKNQPCVCKHHKADLHTTLA